MAKRNGERFTGVADDYRRINVSEDVKNKCWEQTIIVIHFDSASNDHRIAVKLR